MAIAIPLVLAGILGSLWVAGAGLMTPTLRVGDRAPEFALTDLDGRPIRLSDYAGSPVIVNFWASWCLPCVEEFPLLAEALATHEDEGLVVIGIVYRDRSEAARAFADQFGADWPLVMDPGDGVARAYGVYGPPESWLIGRDGVVVGRQIGPFTAEDLAAQLDRLLSAD